MDNRAEGVANARRNACDFERIEESWPHTAGTAECFNSTPIGEASGIVVLKISPESCIPSLVVPCSFEGIGLWPAFASSVRR
jgi:hypothetical protein